MDENANTVSGGSKGGGKTLWVIIGLVVLIGLVWFFMSRNSDTSYSTDDQSGQSTTNGGAKETSLKELLASGVAQTCSFDFKAGEGVESSGKVFISGGKMRGSFEASVNGQVYKSNMINDGTTFYVWMDGQATGFKMSPNMMEQPTTGGSSNSQSVDLNAKYNYNCSAGSVSADNFQLPAGVKFTDFSTMMR